MDKLPPAPEYLNAQAKKIYESSLSKTLLKRGVINEFTLITWVTGCQLIGIWIDFSSRKKTTRSMSVDFGQYRVAKDARNDALAIFREFGLTPLSIAKIMYFTDDSQKDEYERYLSK